MKKTYNLYFVYPDSNTLDKARELIYEFNNESDYDFSFFKITTLYSSYMDNIENNHVFYNYTETNTYPSQTDNNIIIEYNPAKLNDYALKMIEFHLKLLKEIFKTMHNQKSFEEVFISLSGLDKINDTISSFKNPDYPYRSRIHGYESVEYRIPYYDEVKDEYDYIEFKIKYNKYLIFKK